MHHEAYIAIDTAYEEGLVVVFTLSEIVFEKSLPKKLDHAKTISSAIEEALSFCQENKLELSGFFCGLGPGSFVGVRIALSTALGFCTAKDMPLMGFCSHRALVRSKKPCAIFMKASGELGYLTCFDVADQQMSMSYKSQVVALSDVKAMVGDLEIFSDQAEKIHPRAHKITGPKALGIYEAVMENFTKIDQKSFIKPNYVKPPSVTPPKNLREVFIVPRS